MFTLGYRTEIDVGWNPGGAISTSEITNAPWIFFVARGTVASRREKETSEMHESSDSKFHIPQHSHQFYIGQVQDRLSENPVCSTTPRSILGTLSKPTGCPEVYILHLRITDFRFGHRHFGESNAKLYNESYINFKNLQRIAKHNKFFQLFFSRQNLINIFYCTQ